jgi:hypothetical protein
MNGPWFKNYVDNYYSSCIDLEHRKFADQATITALVRYVTTSIYCFMSLKTPNEYTRLCNRAPASSIAFISSKVRSGRFATAKYSFRRNSLEVVLDELRSEHIYTERQVDSRYKDHALLVYPLHEDLAWCDPSSYRGLDPCPNTLNDRCYRTIWNVNER